MHQLTDDRIEPLEHIGISQTYDPYAQRGEIIVALAVVDARLSCTAPSTSTASQSSAQ
jgi:hypothetical protein